MKRHSFRIVSAIRPKPCGNCAFSQNFHKWKLGQIPVFYAVNIITTKFFVKIILSEWLTVTFSFCVENI